MKTIWDLCAETITQKEKWMKFIETIIPKSISSSILGVNTLSIMRENRYSFLNK